MTLSLVSSTGRNHFSFVLPFGRGFHRDNESYPCFFVLNGKTKNMNKTIKIFFFLLPLFLVTSCESTTQRIVLRITIPLAFFGLMSIISTYIKNRKQATQKSQLNEEIDLIVNSKINQIETEKLDSDNQINVKHKFVVKTKSPSFVQYGCLFIPIGVVISWFGFWFSFPIFKPLLFVFIGLTAVWWIVYESTKVKTEIEMIISQNKISFIYENGNNRIDFDPMEIDHLILFDDYQNVKGVEMKKGSWIQLHFNGEQMITNSSTKPDLFKEILNKNDLTIKWAIDTTTNGISLKTILLKFCVDNSIEIKNKI